MRIVTIGPSPCLLTSTGKIHSWIIKQFYEEGNELAVFAHSHDVSYFVPETTTEERAMYCYKFGENKVPLFPYKKGGEPPNKTEAVQIFEVLEKLNPELVITVDDYESMLFMQAVKMFLPDKFKWLWILVNGTVPLNERSRSVVEYVDAILCTNRFTFNHINDFYPHPFLDWCHVGADLNIYKPIEKKNDYFSLFSSAKNSFKDCPYIIMEACQKAREKHQDLSLQLHTNLNDTGFYNLEILQDRFDPNRQFCHLPEEYVSLKDGCSEEKMNSFLNQNHVFVSSSVLSASSISVFEAMAAGCIPVLSKQGCDAEIINLLEEYCGEKDYFTYDTVPFLTTGEKQINIPLVNALAGKIDYFGELIKSRKKYERLLEIILKYSKGYSHLNFLNKVTELVKETVKNDTKVFSTI